MPNLITLAAVMLLTYFSQAHATDNQSLCDLSSWGKTVCLKNLQAFKKQNGTEPLSDDELMQVYGCIKPTTWEKWFGYDQDILGCKQLHGW